MNLDDEKILVSIIVPYYNVEEYIRQCLDSILIQTYTNIEIILIDDGSTDGSGHIVNKYARRDSRIKVFYQANKGLSAARNLGLDNATGDYILFVDSDDFVEKDFVKIALMEIISHNVEIATFGYNLIMPHDGIIIKKNTCMSKALSKEEAIKELLVLKDVVYNYVWNKIYHRDIFKDIRFPIGRTYEDISVMYKLFDLVRTDIYVSDKILYNYRRLRVGSITSNSRTSSAIEDRLVGQIERLNFLNEYYPHLGKIQMELTVDVCLLGLICISKEHRVAKKINLFLHNNKRDILRCIFGMRKLRLFSFYYFPILFILYNLYCKKNLRY